MPMHDWTKVVRNYYRHFHGRWIYSISDRLNKGLLPPDFFATAEQVVVPYAGDVLALELPSPKGKRKAMAGGAALATKPKTRAWETVAEEKLRPRRRVVIRHNSGDDLVAVIELMSASNKRTKAGFRAFVNKSLDCLYSEIHLLLVDPFAPGKGDPHGMHAVLWKKLGHKPKPRTDGKSRLAVSYSVGKRIAAYLEGFDLGERVPDMPLFLAPGKAITVPLEATYEDAWDNVPGPIRDRLLA
jgi:hypothetical protein